MATITDNFNRADASNLGANWSAGYGGSMQLGVASNQLYLVGSDSGRIAARWNANTFGNAQYTQIKVTALPANQNTWLPIGALQVSESAFGFYGLAYRHSSAVGYTLRVATNSANLKEITHQLSVNDVVRFEYDGVDTLTVKVNGSTVGTYTDPGTPRTGNGYIGLYSYSMPAGDTWKLDDFEGGDLPAPGTPVSFSGTIPTQSATEGTPFSADLSTYFSGTETPFAYAVQSGALPAGLTLNSSTGEIAGTPTTPGTASGIVIRATDAGTDTADSNSFSIDVAAADTTAPTLTSPTGTATGQTTASGTVSTDEGNGTLYYLASANSSESAATVKAGSSQSVTATGSQSVSVTGLTAGTGYYLHYVHTDAASNDSTVASSSLFTTDAAPVVVKGVRIQLHDGTTEQASLTGLTVAWFDDDDPATMGAPVLQSSTEATDASGWLEVDLDGYTALGVGDPGFLIVYKAGATAADDIVFAGRLAIEDIG